MVQAFKLFEILDKWNHGQRIIRQQLHNELAIGIRSQDRDKVFRVGVELGGFSMRRENKVGDVRLVALVQTYGGRL